MSQTVILCGNVNLCSLTLTCKGLGLGQEEFKTIFKNNNKVCNLHTIGKLLLSIKAMLQPTVNGLLQTVYGKNCGDNATRIPVSGPIARGGLIKQQTFCGGQRLFGNNP